MGFLDKVFPWLGHGRYQAAPTPALEGTVKELLIDALGRLRVVVDGETALGATAVRQLTAAKRGTLKGTPGSLVEVTVWNKGASPLWLQVHNKGSDVSNGDAAVDQVLVPAGATVGWRPAVPVACATQIRWAASTTPATCTLPAGDDVGLSAAVL